MTKSLDAVLERVHRLPAARQDDIARVLERLVELDDTGFDRLTADDWAEVDRRLARDPSYASNEDVEAFFRKALV